MQFFSECWVASFREASILNNFTIFQSFTTISSGIAPEAELAVVEDKGVNTSTRDLVLAAITVMKGKHHMV